MNAISLPHSKNKDNKADHFSAGKPGVDQLPPEVLLAWASVFTYGEGKYGKHNWRKGHQWSEFYASTLRHLFYWWLGEDNDPESGLPHLSHALWNVSCLMYYQIRALGEDDRDVRLIKQAN